MFFTIFVFFTVSGISARYAYAADGTPVAPAPLAAPADASSAASSSETAPSAPVETGSASTGVSAEAESAGTSAANATEFTELTELEELAEVERVTQYLDELLDTPGVSGNRVGNLLREIPRYGMSFFSRPPSTYAPVTRVPVTAGYVLGPGDYLVINLWGMIEENFEVSINRDGIANVPHIGSIRLVGFTLDEAKSVLKKEFDRYFTGYRMNVTMGEMRSITVYITGDVRAPGAYTVSSFATLVNALLVSGGPSHRGTLRGIELKRGGKTITTFDMYDLLLRGDKSKDVRLMDEDVIFVPTVGPLVGLTGEIRRPGVYEMKGRTRVQDILYLAGGISAQTFRGRIQYYKIQDQHYRSVFEGSVDGLSQSVIADGDVLRLFSILDIPTVVRIQGPVARPGTYGVIAGVTKVSELIAQAGGLLAIASDRAELTRVEPSLSGPVLTRIQIDLNAALNGDRSNDIPLQLNDYLMVQIIPEWETQRMIVVSGEVMHPGNYAVIKGEKLSDLIARAGGFTSKASLKGAVFTRRRVAEEQRRELNRAADRMERELIDIESAASTVGSGISPVERKRSFDFIANLRGVEVPGRIVIKLDVPKAIKGTIWDVELEHEDALFVPEISSTVEVMGAVYIASSHLYNPAMGINDYINASGGYLRSAHKRMIYVLKNDGSIVRLTRDTSLLSSKKWTAPKGFSSAIEPGDTIVAPVKYSGRDSFEVFKDVIDIMYKVAVSAGVLIN
ncbi:MAG: SLBB domain-containing protein [Synergistaceae bacterium]|jgi:protein involved in polysaccharide export with SLBB domain|nr:SLBB domain-containing protein [Synergistaceae bacterium]